MTGQGVFSGVRIIELAQYVFVPGAGVFFTDQGAEVIKIETVGSGDPYRSLRVGDGRELKSTNLAMEQNNRGKKSIALDLKSPEGREALLALIKTADVFLTSLRPKALRALKLDVDDLRAVNPKIIYARGNGLGFRGPEADRPGFDASAFYARDGLADACSPTGQPMTPPRPAMGDHSGSTNVAFGIAGALYKRAMTGEPSVVETSLLATATWMISADITYSQSPQYVVHNPNMNRFPLMTAYTTKDGRRILLMLLDPQPHWPGLCRIIEREDIVNDPRFVDNPARMANAEALVAIIAERMKSRDWSEWQPLFEAWDAPWELIQTISNVHLDPMVIANDMMFDLPLPEGEKVRLVASPVQFDGKALSSAPRRAPHMGENTDELLRSVGYSDEAINKLKAAKAAQ